MSESSLFDKNDVPTPVTDSLRMGIKARGRHRGFCMPEDVEDALTLCERLERELAEKQKTIDGWVAANAPGGWIDDLRTKRSALANSVCNEMDGRGEGDEGPVVTDDVRAALLFALWHHQGGSSRIGQPLRLMLGVGSAEPLRADQIAEAKRVESALAPSATQDRNAIIEECAKVAENCLFTDIAANRIRALKAAPQGFPPASQSPVSAGDAGLSPAGAAPTVKECLPVAEAVLPQDVEDAISGCVSYYGDKYGIGLPLQNDLRSLADLTMRWANGTRGTGDPADASPHAELPSATQRAPIHEIQWVIRSCLDENLMQLHAHAHKVSVIKDWLRSVDSGREA